jgi:mutator protein MutT
VSAGPRRGGGQLIPRPVGWRPGGPAPWAAPVESGPFALDAVVAAVAARTSSRDAAHPDPRDAPLFPNAQPSAVLLALHDGPRGTEVVLTRRSRDLRRHRGEISFPGGRLDGGETPEAAALREAHEEVALEPAAVELIGRLSTLATVVSLSHIVPVVGRLQGRPDLRPAAAEVERILHVPLAELVEPDVFREERWGDGPLERPIYFFELVDETIWGATARILVELLSVVLGVAP